MTPVVTIFAASGMAILALFAAKGFEEKRKKSFFLLRAVKKADAGTGEIYRKSVHTYSEGKEKAALFFNRQMPMHLKNFWNKTVSYLEEKRAEYIRKMRDAKLLKSHNGISEFYKNLSSIEKGNGEINETFGSVSQKE